MRGVPISVGERTSLKTPSIPFGFRSNNLCRRLSELPIPSHFRGLWRSSHRNEVYPPQHQAREHLPTSTASQDPPCKHELMVVLQKLSLVASSRGSVLTRNSFWLIISRRLLIRASLIHLKEQPTMPMRSFICDLVIPMLLLEIIG